MPLIHVCSLDRLHKTVRETGARDVLTVIKNIGQVATPMGVEAERHLKLDFADIWQPMAGEVMANAEHVAEILSFIRRWERVSPLVVHCYAGVSRSTASAYLSACALRPDISESEWAERIRLASPTATPNIHIVRLADQILERDGRMVRAIERIGRGEDCFEGVPFSLDIGPPGDAA
ncbi:MAG: tyrosine phosphatase family protein [Rhabdaerophilum sp.]